MKNIFILYMPPGNYEAMIHYEDTIKNKVDQTKLSSYLDQNLINYLKDIFGIKPIAVWGSRDSSANRSHYEKMQPGDNVLIVEGNTIKLLGKVASKTINPELSKNLWKNLKSDSQEGWNLIYFIANPLEVDVPFGEFKKLFHYSENWSLRGFTSVSNDKLKLFYEHYDDLYSVLERIKNGENVAQIKEDLVKQIEIPINNTEDDQDEQIISDHIRMQWKLLNLGRKCGSKVWIPRNDQKRITDNYQFSEFEKQFTSGIDTSAKYVENIDVVWKEEFRIDAAFEVENSTSIYSGLLRFSDLKIIAPNSTYPLFIVAPRNRKNKVIEQVTRPTFKTMNFNEKVRFLSYEMVDEIDTFFTNNSSGLNIELLNGKSEILF